MSKLYELHLIVSFWLLNQTVNHQTNYEYLLFLYLLNLVPTERLELSRPKSQPPQGCVSTNSTTTATILTSPNLVRNIFRGIANWRRHSNRCIAWCRFCRFSFNWFIVNFNFLCLSSSFYHTTIACTVACHIS